jgi:hypothetical protein
MMGTTVIIKSNTIVIHSRQLKGTATNYDYLVCRTGALGTELPPTFINLLFTYFFSIKFLYFLIMSSLFPYFNLFVSIFI